MTIMNQEDALNAAPSIANAPASMPEYQGVGKRFFALVIDTIILGILFWVFVKVFSGTYVGGCSSGFSIGSKITINNNVTFYGLCGLPAQLYFLVLFAYQVVLEWKFGGTPGKLAIGMRVIKSTGEALDFKASLIRNILRIVDFLPFFYLVGAISIWNSTTKQRIGDRVAKTVVVSR